MKKTVRIISLLFALLIFSLPVSAKSDFPKPTDRFFVNDFANVIDSSAEDEIYSRSASLYKQTTAQVVVVTVNTLDGMEPYEYALELGREWGVGSKEDDNGVVVLLAKEEREIYIAVGYGLEGALPDSKTGVIIDTYGLEYLRNDDFSNGLLEITKAIINETYIEYGLEPEEGYTEIEDTEYYEDGYGGKVAISWVIMIIIIILYLIFFGGRGGRGRRRNNFILFGPPFFGGGFSGGSFGSGSFKGGGFGGGGFSGGGGSFGGGGAGRGF